MNQTDVMDRALEEALKLTEEAWDSVLKDLGSPEDLLGKKYPQWTPEDVQLLLSVFGSELNRMIADLEIQAVKRLEKQVING